MHTVSEQEKTLFVVMLGGKHPKAKIEIHDVVFVVATTLQDAHPALRERVEQATVVKNTGHSVSGSVNTRGARGSQASGCFEEQPTEPWPFSRRRDRPGNGRYYIGIRRAGSAHCRRCDASRPGSRYRRPAFCSPTLLRPRADRLSQANLPNNR